MFLDYLVIVCKAKVFRQLLSSHNSAYLSASKASLARHIPPIFLSNGTTFFQKTLAVQK
jgi:hypothetical protein